jgi:SAM-dependent methyltransferase
VTSRSFEELVSEAWNVDREGWGFSWLEGRTQSAEPPWDYRGRAAELVHQVDALLDVDTGGGELLAGLAPLPRRAVAVESWGPNLEMARSRLSRFGVRVEDRIEAATNGEGGFELVLNRHGRLDASAIASLLRPGGRLLTQQVGSRNQFELNEQLGAPVPRPADSWTLSVAIEQLEAAGLRVQHAEEALLPFTFRDIGAVVYQLRMVAWQIPDFDPKAYEAKLQALDRRIRADGGFTVHDHRFYLEAALPPG